MTLTETNKYVDTIQAAIWIVIDTGDMIPTDKELSDMYNAVEHLQVRDVMDEMFAAGDWKCHEERLKSIMGFRYDVRTDSVSYLCSSFKIGDRKSKYADVLKQCYAHSYEIDAYIRHIQRLAGLIMQKIRDVETAMGLLKDKHLSSGKESITEEPDEFKANEKPELDEADIFLRSIFGEHLNDFLNEAKTLKKGSDVARLVNWYVREYNLRKNFWKKGDLNKPLWNALRTKGIETASISTWNNTIK